MSVVQALPSLQTTGVPAWQLPPPQMSPAVQASPSSQAAVLLVCTQPEPGTQESSVHGLLSLQFKAPAPAWQVPPEHVSPVVQALPSSHAAVLFVKTHPVAGTQLSVVQTLLSLQASVPAPGWQLPPPQVSPVVQALPSSQATVLFVKTHPVAGLHVSVVQTLLSLQASVPAPGWQLPPPQVSPVVQALPSLQETVLFACAQPVAGTQESFVHGLLSSQFRTPAPGRQLPPPHVSPVVHALPSLQETALFACAQPLAGTHESSVHGLVSSQFRSPAPGWQLPPPQVSPVVQALPSSQAAVLFVKTQPVAGAHVSVVQTLPSLQTRVPAPG